MKWPSLRGAAPITGTQALRSDGLKERSNLLWHCRALGMATSQVGEGECLGVCAAAPTPMLKWASFRHPASHPVCA